MKDLILSFYTFFLSFLPSESGDVQDVTSTLSFLAIVIGAVWTILMLRREIRNLERTNRASNYAELDRNYTEILLQAIDRPHLRDPSQIEQYVEWIKLRPAHPKRGKARAGFDADFEQKARAYETYAFVTMNFVETIRDRCYESAVTAWRWKKRPFRYQRADEVLIKTWKPIITSECSLHGQWFTWETRLDHTPQKFCKGFRDFVLHERWDKDSGEWGDRPDKVIQAAEAQEQSTTHAPSGRSQSVVVLLGMLAWTVVSVLSGTSREKQREG